MSRHSPTEFPTHLHMDPLFYQILHVTSAILLVAYTFYAFASPVPERRSASLRNTGILALIVFVAGFGLMAKVVDGFPIWVVIKMICWLGIAGITGFAFRKPEKTKGLMAITVLFVLVAVLVVYIKPFVAS